MKAMVLREYGQQASFEVADSAPPELKARSRAGEDCGFQRQHSRHDDSQDGSGP